MKRFLQITLLLTLFTTSVYSQYNANDSTVQFVTYWVNHDTITYHLIQEEYKINSKDTIQRITTDCDIFISILDSTESGYKVKWTFQNYHSNTPNPVLKKISDLINNSSIVYSIDSLGVFQEVLNVEEIAQYMKIAMDTLRSTFKSIPNINIMADNFQKMYSTKEAIETYAIEEVKLFHFAHGAKFKLNQTYEDDIESPNIFGGSPLKSKREMAITDYDSENHSATIKTQTYVKEEELKRITSQALNALFAGTNIPKTDNKTLPKIEIDYIFANRIHLDTGWVLDFFKLEEVKAGDVTKVKTMEMYIK